MECAFSYEVKILNNRFLVIDLETTGDNPIDHSITQIGAVLIEGGKVIDTFSTFVYTEQEIPTFIQELTGITNEMLVDAPTMDEVMVQLLPMLEGSVFVAHNANFDLGFIQKSLDQLGYEPFDGLVLDTLLMARIILPMVQSYKLNSLTDELDIQHDNPHRADDDALATAELLLQLLDQLEEMPLIYLQRLRDIIRYSFADLAIYLEEYIEKKQLNFTEKEQSYIVMNQLALQPIEEFEMEAEENERIVPVEELFGQNGVLSTEFPDFEVRPSQKQMAKKVIQAFENSAHLMVEAGTGTGKSLAYLLPSIYWAKEYDEKIVVSTHTINLQEQLFHKDIPLLKKILPFSFSATILKGRNNYLCLRKFEQAAGSIEDERNKESITNLSQMLTWVYQTNTGDVEEINLPFTAKELWNQVKSDKDSCLNRACPWFKMCFYHRAKQKAQLSDLIITNHSLLLTDLQAEHRILPGYQRLIVDEAHHFEDVALKHLGYEINQFYVHSLFQHLYKDAKNGFLVSLMNELFATKDTDSFAVGNQIQNHSIPLLMKVEGEFQTYFNLINEFVEKTCRKNENGRVALRITEAIKEKEEWAIILQVVDNLYVQSTELLNQMEEQLKRIKELEIEESLLVDFKGYLQELRYLFVHLQEWNYAKDTNMVFWIEAEQKRKRIFSYLLASPIEIGEYLKAALFDKKESVILTSATLSVNESFNYSYKKFGFDEKDEQMWSLKLPSPFDYKKQAVMYIPKDFPNIQEISEKEYIHYLAKSIGEIAISMNGKTLVLFTSHQMLQDTYYLLKKILQPFHIQVLGHGIDSTSRSKLTTKFKTNNQTVLLGTSSFWEGVDIPGESLSALIIARLPFNPPNHPVQEAKTEKLRSEGKNPFTELSVPQAVIRFKQGFGRLIRTQKDKGIVVIFDRRIMEARYGKAFVRSLPPLNIVYQPMRQLITLMEEWMEKE